MGKERFPLDKIKVAAPCTAEWRFMLGNERARFCGQCSQYVYNLSEMTREQAEDLILRHDGRLCVRFYRRKDGTIITNNCPVGLRALKAKYTSTKATILKAAMTFLSYLGVLWWVEGPPIVTSVQGGVVCPEETTVVTGDMGISDLNSATHTVRRSEAFIRSKAMFLVIPVFIPTMFKHVGPADVIVDITIDEEGQVEEARLVRGHPLLKEMAEAAARRWEFEPMTEDGKPVSVESTLTFHFGQPLNEMNRLPMTDKKACAECL